LNRSGRDPILTWCLLHRRWAGRDAQQRHGAPAPGAPRAARGAARTLRDCLAARLSGLRCV